MASSAVAGFMTTHAPSPAVAAQAAVHGYTTAFWWSAGIFAIGAVVSALVLRPGVAQPAPRGEPALAH